MHIHFIAIGGSVMHQLAIALRNKGHNISGSDDEIFEPASTNLKNAGIFPRELGWHPEKIDSNIEAVILGMHAKQDNPELIRAKEMGIKIYSFPEYIYEESKDKIRVAIGGSHGKTTTTAMIMHVLKYAGKDFDYLVGAKLNGFEQGVKITHANVIVCEADEYPASVIEKRPKFHFLFPHIAVITGIAWDHINVFPTFDFYIEQFIIFINKIETNGVLIYNQTDPVLERLINENKRKDLTYIPYHLPSHYIENGLTSVMIDNRKTPLKVFGNHNLLNLTAAHYVCKKLKVSDHIFAEAIASFTGAARRLELLFESSERNVYRDFAHAPSKVEASVTALKQQFPDRKLVAILELHTFSSLNKEFIEEYKGTMENADDAIVFYSDHALKLKRMPALDSEIVVHGFNKANLKVINDTQELIKTLHGYKKIKANLLFMSSGNYDGIDLLAVLGLTEKYHKK